MSTEHTPRSQVHVFGKAPPKAWDDYGIFCKAAPDLLEALEDLVEKIEDAGWHHEITETARSAIAKAKGETDGN